MSSYKTKQKNIILNYIKNLKSAFTAKDIYSGISNLDVGLTTIYRCLETLEKESKIKKIIENNISKYQYLDSCNHINHFYLKCNVCNKIIHTDCECIADFKKHFIDEHEFELDKDVIIFGICNDCKKEGI